MTPADGGAAFPNTGNSNWALEPEAGMSLRDWFAGRFAPVIVAAMAADQYETEGKDPATLAAEHAYRCADAMLAARGR